MNYAERTRTWLRRVRVGKITISFNSQNNDMMTGGAQARLRPSLIPLFPREIKKMKNGMKEKGINC